MHFTFGTAVATPLRVLLVNPDTGDQRELFVPPMRIADWRTVSADEHARRVADVRQCFQSPLDAARFLSVHPVAEVEFEDMKRTAYTLAGAERILELCLLRCEQGDGDGPKSKERRAWAAATRGLIVDNSPTLDDVILMADFLSQWRKPQPPPPAEKKAEPGNAVTSPASRDFARANDEATFASEGDDAGPLAGAATGSAGSRQTTGT